MSKKVYAVRILVESDEVAEVVESRVRGWGEATFEGFVLLDLAHVRTSLAEIDTFAHTIAKMIKSQENIHEVLEKTTSAFTETIVCLKDLIGVVDLWGRPSEAIVEEAETEDVQTEETTAEEV